MAPDMAPLRNIACGKRLRHSLVPFGLGGRRRQLKDEFAPLADGAFDAYLAAMFLEDFARHRQAQARAAAALARDEHSEDRLDIVRRDAPAIVFDYNLG